MISAMLSIPLILAVLLAMMRLLGCRQAQAALQPEIRRKLVHIAMGTLALSLPWLLPDPFHVSLLVILATILLAVVRYARVLKLRLGGALHEVSRKSYGELCFPIAIASLYSLADGNWLYYLVPLLMVTFGDALAALVGIYRGRNRYRTPDGYKSLEGSMTMFCVSMVCILLPLYLQGSIAFENAVLIAFNLALGVTLIEAISWRGLDNFTIPIAGLLLLQAYLPMEFVDLLAYALVNSVAGAIILMALTRPPLMD